MELTLGWRTFEFYSETELFIDFGDSSDDFLYTWSQATWSPLHWLSLGISGQRLRSVDSERTIDIGPMAVFRLGRAALEAYAYNPLAEDFFGVLGAGIEF